MKVSIERDRAKQLAEYHALEMHGLAPVIETSADLLEWVQFTIAGAVGCPESEIGVIVRADEVVINAVPEIIGSLRLSWLD